MVALRWFSAEFHLAFFLADLIVREHVQILRHMAEIESLVRKIRNVEG